MQIKRPLVFFSLVFIFGVFLGLSFFKKEPIAINKPVSFIGIVDSEAKSFKNSQQFLLKTKHYSKVSIRLINSNKQIKYGDKISLSNVELKKNEKATNPKLSSYADYLANKKIYYYAEITDSDFELIARKKGNFFKALAIDIKNLLVKVNNETLPEKFATLQNSIILGSLSAELDAETKLIYQRTGVIHLLVVSGSQVALLLGVCFNLFGYLKLNRLLTIFIITIINLLFILITGAEASIIRAGIMTETAIIGKLMQKDTDVYTTMAFAGLISTILNPMAIFDIGFQLSFVATWSLVYVAPVFQEKFTAKLPKWLATSLAVSLAPFLATMPLTIYHFSGFSVYALPLNMIAIPIVEILVLLGFIAILLGIIFIKLALIINGFNFVLLFCLDKIVNFFADLPYNYLFIRQPNFFLVIFAYLMIVASIEKLKNNSQVQENNNFLSRQGFKVIFLIAFLFFTVGFSFLVLNQDKVEIEITMLDVGQADAILISKPLGQKILVDTAHKNTAQRVIVPWLQKQGINQLDIMILTHGHSDHIGGATFLLDNVKTKLVIDNGATTGNWNFREYRKMIKKKKIPLIAPTLNMTLKLDKDFYLIFLNEINFLEKKNENENSLVFKLVYKNFSMLFTGDMEKTSESSLVKQQGNKLSANVLKVGHHGSRYASRDDFLNFVNPKIALISCGKDNKFGHPHQEAIERLTEKKIVVKRTDMQGAITIKTDGNKFTVSSFKE